MVIGRISYFFLHTEFYLKYIPFCTYFLFEFMQKKTIRKKLNKIKPTEGKNKFTFIKGHVQYYFTKSKINLQGTVVYSSDTSTSIHCQNFPEATLLLARTIHNPLIIISACSPTGAISKDYFQSPKLIVLESVFSRVLLEH